MNLAIKSVFLVVSISVLSVWSVPHPGYPIANFNDSRFSNFSAFWKIPEECKSASGNPYIAGLCNSYFNILVQIHERKLTYLEYKNDSKMEEVDKFCEHFVAVLPATTSVEPVHDNIKQFKEKFGGVPFCERTCQPVDWETALTYTIELCKLVHFGYSELAKTQVAIQPFAALQKEAQGNVSVQVTQPQPVVESAPDAKPVDLTPLTTKSPAVPLTHKDVASKKPNVDEYYPDRSNPERSEEYPKASNAEAAKKPALVPTARVVPTKKSDSPVHHPAVPSVQVTPPAAKVKADAEQQIDRERNLQNEQNLEDVNGVNPENVEIEDDKTKGTETNPNLEANAAAEEENADESQKDYGEEDLETVDDSLRDNNRDDTVQKIPARHLPEPEVEIQHNQPYDNSEESPRKKEVVADPFLDETDSNFFTYFIFIMFACIICYVVYHNKSKILALLLEGRRGSASGRGGRRKHTAAYRKLDSNLEEALLKNSGKSSNMPEIIY